MAASGRLVDFSTVGASFLVGNPIALPEIFWARLRSLKEGMFDVQAWVVWIRREKNATHYGIKFGSLTPVHPSDENS